MRIEGKNRTGQVSGRTATSRGDGGLFRLDDTADTTPLVPASQPAAMTGIEALLTLQAVGDPLLARRKVVKRASDLLDELEQLKTDLLAGHLGEGHLNRMTALLAQVQDADDPALRALIDDIELRALVELAKRGRYPG